MDLKSNESVTNGPKALVERLFAAHGSALQAFFRRRIRSKPEAPDLTQEVYLRMLRVADAELIRNPEGYLYTVASNLLKERAVIERRQREDRALIEAEIEEMLADFRLPEHEVDRERRMARLREVLMQLTPKCRAAVVLQYRYGLSYQEIGQKLGVSTNMVKKYLAQALAVCRQRMQRMR